MKFIQVSAALPHSVFHLLGNNGITESLRVGNTSEIIQSSHRAAPPPTHVLKYHIHTFVEHFQGCHELDQKVFWSFPAQTINAKGLRVGRTIGATDLRVRKEDLSPSYGSSFHIHVTILISSVICLEFHLSTLHLLGVAEALSLVWGQ